MLKRRLLALLGGFCATGLTGCFSSVRHVQLVMPATMYHTAEVGVLEKQISDRDAAIRTLSATVMITASSGGGKTGKVTTYTSFRGYIFVQKPRNLRVLLQLPVIGSKALDMVSDGKTFTMVVPPKSLAIVGTNEVTKPSKNGLENLRPAVFFDSLLVPGVLDSEWVTLTESSRVLQPARGKRDAVSEPDYELEVAKVKSGNTLQQERVIHISRVNMMPFQQDIYDDQGRVVTQAMYENYQPTGPGLDDQFPRLITIVRPLDDYSLKVEITKLTLNATFDADQFEPPKIPPTYKKQEMR